MSKRPKGEGEEPVINIREAKVVSVETYREVLHARIKDVEQEFDDVPFCDKLTIANDTDMNRKLWADSCARVEVLHETWVHK